MIPDHKIENDRLRQASGIVRIKSHLIEFLYELLRDHLPAADVESLVRNSTQEIESCIYTNGWLALYAEDLAKRLAADPTDRERALESVIRAYRAYFEDALEDTDSPGTRRTYQNMVDLGNHVLGDK